jgi:hypothetical protein
MGLRMIVAIYARVSTTDQSCEIQLHELRQYLAKRGLEVFQEYVDTGFSGAAASRPRLDQLLRDARLRKFEAVLVWKLDRWGRSVAHCVRSIQELVSLGVRFLSPTESRDCDNKVRREREFQRTDPGVDCRCDSECSMFFSGFHRAYLSLVFNRRSLACFLHSPGSLGAPALSRMRSRRTESRTAGFWSASSSLASRPETL